MKVEIKVYQEWICMGRLKKDQEEILNECEKKWHTNKKSEHKTFILNSVLSLSKSAQIEDF